MDLPGHMPWTSPYSYNPEVRSTMKSSSNWDNQAAISFENKTNKFASHDEFNIFLHILDSILLVTNNRNWP